MKPLIVALIFLSAIGVLVAVTVIHAKIDVVKIGDLTAEASEYHRRHVQLDDCKISKIESHYPLRFQVAPMHGEAQSIAVSSKVSPPSQFDEGLEVALAGSYDPQSGIFTATTIKTKCPSRYEATEEFKKQNPERYQEYEKLHPERMGAAQAPSPISGAAAANRVPGAQPE